MTVQRYVHSFSCAEPAALAEVARGLCSSDELIWYLAYAPDWLGFGLIDSDGVYTDHKGSIVLDRRTFELRIFCKSFELRWLKRQADGKLALITEDSNLALSEEHAALSESKPSAPEPCEIWQQSFLLWGMRTASSTAHAGWTHMGTARIGSYWAPFETTKAQGRIHLHGIEYITSEAEHGNSYVLGQRLSHLSADSAPLQKA